MPALKGRKAKPRLAARQQAFDAQKNQDGYKRPGSNKK